MASKLEKGEDFFENVVSFKKNKDHLDFLKPKQILDALEEAKTRIAPLWDVRDYVAVNPLFGYRDQKVLTTLQRVLSLTGTLLLPEKSFFKQCYETHEILDADLNTSLMLLQKESLLTLQSDYDSKSLVQFLDSKIINITKKNLTKSISDLCDIQDDKKRTDVITKEISKWASAYFDEGQSLWKMPGKEKRFFEAWKDLAQWDATFAKISPKFKILVQNLPRDPEKAVVQMIQELETFRMNHSLPIVDYLARNLATVSGWASYIQKFEFEDQLYERTDRTQKVGGLVDLIAIRLAYDLSLLDQVHDLSQLGRPANPKAEALQEIECRYIWLQALEIAKRREIVKCFNFSNPSVSLENRPLAQMAFCIDVRSEVIRRQLESQSNQIQTIGFAGFFGLPISVKRFGFSGHDSQCPVLIKPSVEVHESAYRGTEKLKQKRQGAIYALYAMKGMQSSMNSSFSVAETFGFASAIKMLLAALFRMKPNVSIESLGFKNKKTEEVFLDHAHLDLNTKVGLVAGALQNMGLTQNFAPYVFFFGHGAESSNNPYESALDCGACAGHKGLLNSQLLAALLNDVEVRKGLEAKAIHIPEETVFIPGWHNTTLDHLIVDDLKSYMENSEDYMQISEILSSASESCLLERANYLPHAKKMDAKQLQKEVCRRANDWSEIRPEWALARNHSFIVARRPLTRKMNLEGRSFLHDYDFSMDTHLSKLELIMTAPMIVTNWINMQYFASTIDPNKFGTGNKTLNNVVGTIGCIQGNESDLLGGLSEQSVRYKGQYFHEPVRLQVFIEAPCQSIDEIIKRHEMVRELIDNGWLHILSIDTQNKTIKLRHEGSWINIKEGLWN